MNKFLTITAAATLAVVTSLSAISPSKADPAGAAIAGGVVGFMAGAMAGAAAAGPGPHYVYRDSDFGRFRAYGPRYGFRSDIAWRSHVRDCFRAYASYDPRSDTYIGRDRRAHRCVL
jgi:hypothetical protein